MRIKSICILILISIAGAFQVKCSVAQAVQTEMIPKLRFVSDSIDQISFDSGPYALNLKRESILLGTGAVTAISGLILMNNITPLTTEEIAKLDPNDINSFDRKSIGAYRETNAGDVLLYASCLLPLTFLADKRTKRDWKILGVIGIEVLLIQAGLTAVVKGLTLRTRPYVYDPNTPMDKKMSKDARVSFYSGHTSTTAAMSFYVAKVFQDYLTDKTAKTFIWAGAAVYPALVGYWRRDSGHHFQTDVICGYLAGALIGYFIPELHRVRKTTPFSFDYIYSGDQVTARVTYNF